MGIRPETPGRALRIGTAVHELLHLIKTGHDINGELPGLDGYDLSDLEMAAVSAMVRGWVWRWETDPVEVLHSEHTYRVKLTNPVSSYPMRDWRAAGQIDGIVNWQGKCVVMEHKTCGEDISPAAHYWERLRMDLQCSNYHTAALELGYPVEGVLYDVIRKPVMTQRQVPLLDSDGLKVVLDGEGNRVLKSDGTPRQTPDKSQGWELQSREETPQEWHDRVLSDIYDRPDYYYQRRLVPRLHSDLVEAAHDNVGWVEMIKHLRNKNSWPRNTSACTDFGGCPYQYICANGIDVTQEVPDGFVFVDDLHPELRD